MDTGGGGGEAWAFLDPAKKPEWHWSLSGQVSTFSQATPRCSYPFMCLISARVEVNDSLEDKLRLHPLPNWVMAAKPLNPSKSLCPYFKAKNDTSPDLREFLRRFSKPVMWGFMFYALRASRWMPPSCCLGSTTIYFHKPLPANDQARSLQVPVQVIWDMRPFPHKKITLVQESRWLGRIILGIALQLKTFLPDLPSSLSFPQVSEHHCGRKMTVTFCCFLTFYPLQVFHPQESFFFFPNLSVCTQTLLVKTSM